MPIRIVEKTKAEMREDQSVKDKKPKKMLIGGQTKLDKNKNNRIDSEDFELLRASKKRKGGVMKAVRGRLAGQDFSERMKNVEKGLINKKTGKPTSMMAMRELKGYKTGELPKEFNKRRMALAGAKEALKRTKIGKIALGVAGAGLAAKAFLDKKRKEAKEKKQNKKMGGGMMKTPGYRKGKGVMIMIAVGKPKKKMGGGLAAATERLKAQGKMGGGMMKKYTKGGGADMGKYSLSRRDVKILGKKGTEKLMESRAQTARAYALAQSMKDKDRLTERDIKKAKSLVKGKMGGGMMKPQKAVLGMLFRKKKKATPGMKMVQSSPGGFGLLGRLAKKVGLSQGGGADTGRMGEIKSKLGVATNQINRMKIPGRLTQRDKEVLKEITKIKGRKFKPLSVSERTVDALKDYVKGSSAPKKMGGGMMQPAMPMYKKGTMIKARGGGLAKTKPTKMY